MIHPLDVWECEFDGHLWVLLVTSNKMISIVWYGNCPRQVQWNLNQSTAVTNTSWWKLCLCTYNHHWNIRNVSLNLLPPRQWSSPYSQTKLEISLAKVWEFSLWALTFEVLIKTLQISTATNWMPLQSLLILSILKAKLAVFMSGSLTGFFKDSTAICCNEKIQTGKDQQQTCSKIEMRAQIAL